MGKYQSSGRFSTCFGEKKLFSLHLFGQDVKIGKMGRVLEVRIKYHRIGADNFTNNLEEDVISEKITICRTAGAYGLWYSGS